MGLAGSRDLGRPPSLKDSILKSGGSLKQVHWPRPWPRLAQAKALAKALAQGRGQGFAQGSAQGLSQDLVQGPGHGQGPGRDLRQGPVKPWRRLVLVPMHVPMEMHALLKLPTHWCLCPFSCLWAGGRLRSPWPATWPGPCPGPWRPWPRPRPRHPNFYEISSASQGDKVARYV